MLEKNLTTKVVIEKRKSFADGLFEALATLEPSGSIEVCASTKHYTQNLISKWNRAHRDGPCYKVQLLEYQLSGRDELKVTVCRVK